MFYAFLALLLAAAVGEYVTTGRLTLGGAALFYVALRMQAERAAHLFAKYGKDGPPPSPWEAAAADAEKEMFEPWLKEEPAPKAAHRAAPAENPELKVNSLGGKGKQKQYYGPRPHAESPAEPNAGARLLPFRESAARAEREEKTQPTPRPAPARKPPRAPFAAPRFNGAPHEVLGVDRHADTRQILGAFRYWIKRHHPDHAGPEGAARAGDQARRLHEAKSALLRSRKGRGKDNAA